MGVVMQAFYTLDRGKKGVPCPQNGSPQVDWWWDHLAKQAQDFAKAGFTALWLPPPWKAGAGIASIGYDVFDDYDLGSKDQKGHVPTRYGTREQLARCVAVLRANGIDVYVDYVANQRGGDPGDAVFRYKDADGHVGDPRHQGKGGRFPKDPPNFHFVPGGVPQDPHVFQDFLFGRDLAPINGKPHRYVFDGLLDAADWMVRALDIQGFRIDDVKGVSTDFVFPLLEHGAMKGKFAVGEFFDGNLALVRNWVSNPNGMRGRASAFDFPLRGLLFQLCNNAGFFDMSHLDRAGLAGADPFHAVTFVENHDTDSKESAIVRNKAQGYALILTSEGYPCVFYKDYSTDLGCYGLKSKIDNLIWIHEKLAEGPTRERWKDHDVFAYERLGGRRLLVGLNNNGATDRTITVDTGFGSHARLHDYSGHSPDVTTDGAGKATIRIPRNHEGTGYVCYSRSGIDDAIDRRSHEVTQDYEGAVDLDIRPATPGEVVQVCRVWVEANTDVRAVLHVDSQHWTAATRLDLELLGPTGKRLATKAFTSGSPQGDALVARAVDRGWHTFRLQAASTPAAAPRPSYRLRVSYRAPQTGL